MVVVCPFNFLAKTLIGEITATSLTGDDIDEDKLLCGHYSFIFANPESLIQNEKWRQVLQKEVYLKYIFAIVTDEAHVITSAQFYSTSDTTLAKLYRSFVSNNASKTAKENLILSPNKLI